MRKITEAIIHCTATRPEFMAGASTADKVAEIRRWHVEERGWRDIGYHFLIDRDGSVAIGRPVERSGAHVKGHNAGTIGISLFGGHGSSAGNDFADNFTHEQGIALRNLLTRLKREHNFTKISGHNEYAAKACPGFRVGRWLAGKPSDRDTPTKSTTLQATAAAAVSGAGGTIAAISKLDPATQAIVAVTGAVALLALAWIARERLRKFAGGDK